MALGLNKASLIGNVGNDPEFRFTKDGKEFCTFSFATTESWRDRHSGEKKERTEWHRIIIFSDGLVEIVRKFISKGAKLFMEGAIQTRKFNDSRGQEVFRTEIVLQGSGVLILLESKRDKFRESSNQDADTSVGQGSTGTLQDLEDELPSSNEAPF